MFEYIVVVAIVALAVLTLSRNSIRRSLRKGKAAADGTGAVCGTCPIGGKSGSCHRVSLLVLAGLTLPGPSRAVDTIECYPNGALDLEMYVGSEGLGLAPDARELHTQGVLGVGLADWFSAYVGLTSCGDGRLANAKTLPSLGFIATPLAAESFSGDFTCDFSSDARAGVLEISPALELNFDAQPEQISWGLYLRQGACFAGRTEDGGGTPEWWSTLGLYRTVVSGHQLILELGAARGAAQEGRVRWAIDRWAVGYNAGVASNIELITQIQGTGLRGSPAPRSVAFSTGIIASLPLGR